MVSSKYLTTFSDFRYHEGDPKKDPDFMSIDDYVAYLERYCTQFNLWPHIRLSKAVRRISQQKDGKHIVTVQPCGPSQANASEEQFVFDGVAVCSGLHVTPNIPGLPGHNWSSGIASATPIAHKGVVAGAKAQAMTVLDLLTKPELVKQAWAYFNDVQTKDVKYIPFITKDTPAPTHLNEAILGKYREQMRKYYYDPTKFKTYLEQLGIEYPTVRKQ